MFVSIKFRLIEIYIFSSSIIKGRVCHGSYHWRCVKPETISHYGENTHFICDKCNDNITTTTSPTHRLSNGGIRIKSPDSSEMDYRNFVNIPSKLNTIPTKDTSVVNTVRYFEEKQQQQGPSIAKSSKLNEHTNGNKTLRIYFRSIFNILTNLSNPISRSKTKNP